MEEFSRELPDLGSAAVRPACTHGEAITQYTGDGSPVSYCPDCGRNEPIGGAAVRGEAVAESDSAKMIDGLNSLLSVERRMNLEMKRANDEKNLQIRRLEIAVERAVISARAADAHSEPSDSQMQAMLMALLQCSASELEDYSPKLMDGYERDVRNVYCALLKSRAADALDSQPTDGGVRNG